MYRITATSKQYRASTVIHIAISEHLDDGSEVLLTHLTESIPAVSGGLFDESPRETFDVFLARLSGLATRIRDTHQ